MHINANSLGLEDGSVDEVHAIRGWRPNIDPQDPRGKACMCALRAGEVDDLHPQSLLDNQSRWICELWALSSIIFSAQKHPSTFQLC